jgi:hypothetical protein
MKLTVLNASLLSGKMVLNNGYLTNFITIEWEETHL